MQEEVMSTVIFLGIGFKLLSSPGWWKKDRKRRSRQP
jgi:hypothetical protein